MSVTDGGTQHSSALATEKKKYFFNLCICNYYRNQTEMHRN